MRVNDIRLISEHIKAAILAAMVDLECRLISVGVGKEQFNMYSRDHFRQSTVSLSNLRKNDMSLNNRYSNRIIIYII